MCHYIYHLQACNDCGQQRHKDKLHCQDKEHNVCTSALHIHIIDTQLNITYYLIPDNDNNNNNNNNNNENDNDNYLTHNNSSSDDSPSSILLLQIFTMPNIPST